MKISKKIFAFTMTALVSMFLVINLSGTGAAADTYLNLDDKWSFYYYGSELIIAVPPANQTQDRIAFFKPKSDIEFSQTVNTKNFGKPGNNNPVLLPDGCEGAHLDLKKSELSGDSGQQSQTTVKPWLFQPEKGSCKDEDYWQNTVSLSKAPDVVIAKAKAYNSNIFDGVSNEGNPLDDAVANTGDKNTDNTDTDAMCSQALSPFGWVLCPATNFADNLYSFFKTLVNNLLFFESDKYENNGLYDSWKIMVTLANTVLVLVAIVMIAAQIFNFEFISAYTVKKALPRIVIAAILIQLSWFMVTTGIQIVNAIGSGLYWLLVAPFASKIPSESNGGILEISSILAQGYSGSDVGNTVGNAIVFYYVIVGIGAAAVGAAVSGLWISIIIAAIGVVISLLVAIVTLVIREVLLIVLIAIAPLAIAFWILPGTNGLWNMWWKTFSKLLLMYPLIMLLFAGGTIAAILLASTGSGINILFAIIAFFAPMFMIGATYKFAGGAFASIANMTGKLGDKAKGSGMFGLRDKAKFAKENSSWAMAKNNREANRQRNAQLKYANRMQGEGAYSRYLQRKSGLDARGRSRAMANAASAIEKDEAQAYAEQSELAKMIVKSAGKDYQDQRDARASILRTAIGSRVNINGKEYTVTKDIKDQVAVEALKNKEHGAVDYYVDHDNGRQNLSQLATNSTEAFSAIDRYAPDLSRNSDITPGSPSWDASLANFKDIGDDRREAIGVQIEQMSRSANVADRNLALTQISRLARDTSVSPDQLEALAGHLGISNLAELRRNEQSRIVFDPTTGRPTIIS
jgi:hypothetical protein